MKTFPRLLTLLLMLSAMACWAQPAVAARLASVAGQAGESEQRDDAQFKLGDHSQVEIQYKITKLQESCSVKVRVHRKQSNGTWLVVSTPLRTNKSVGGSRTITLPAGEYKIEVISKQARFDVSVDM